MALTPELENLLNILKGLCPECSSCAEYSEICGCGGDCDSCKSCNEAEEAYLFATKPVTKQIICEDIETQVADVIPKDVICVPEYIPVIPLPTPIDCSGQPTDPVWVENGQTQQIGCDTYNEEVDTNPCSATYNTIRLVNAIVLNITLTCEACECHDGEVTTNGDFFYTDCEGTFVSGSGQMGMEICYDGNQANSNIADAGISGTCDCS